MARSTFNAEVAYTRISEHLETQDRVLERQDRTLERIYATIDKKLATADQLIAIERRTTKIENVITWTYRSLIGFLVALLFALLKLHGNI